MIIEQASSRTSWRHDTRLPGARGDSAPARTRNRIRVLVVDEKGIMRDGLCALLAVMPDVEIVGSVSIGADCLRTVASLRPAVVVIDFPPTPLKGLKLIASLKAESPGTHIVMLSFHREDHLLEAAVRAGAEGYVLKTDSRDDLFDAVRMAAAGKRFTSPSIRGYVIRGSARKSDAERALAPRTIDLTQRERQVISLIAAGRRTREIAQALSLSHKTIEKHRATLMRKLGLRNASAVAAYAIAHGLADS
jgi:DNA-binding NarL/FixJ family response regulator